MLFGRSAVRSWGWSNRAGSTSSGRTGWCRAGLPCSWARHSHRGTRCTRSRRVKRPSPACSRTPGTRAVTRGSRTSLGVVLVAAGVRWLGCAHPRASSPAAASPKEMTASAVSTVSAEDLHGIPAAQVEELLEGRSAGVTRRLAGYETALLLLAAQASAQAAHDRHVFFERSLTDTAYYFSEARAITPSTLAAARGKLPVETTHVFTPPNALRLTWTSRPGGTWHAGVRRESWRNQTAEFTGDSLVLRAYTDAAIPAGVLPLIGIEDAQGLRRELRLADYYKDGLPAKQWLRVTVPIGQLAMTLQDGRTFDPHHAATVFFEQWLDDGAPHTLYIDEIAITSGDPRDTTPPPVRSEERRVGKECRTAPAVGPD